MRRRRRSAQQGRSEESWVVRIYRRALRSLLPDQIWEVDGEEMVGVFRQLLSNTERPWQRWRILIRCLFAVPRVGLAEWIDAKREGGSRRLRHRRAGARKGGLMAAWSKDLGYATRTLTRTPGFTVGAVMLLALGVGAVTSIFTLVDNILLRSLPYPNADRLVVIEGGSHSGPFFKALDEVTAVEHWAGAFGEQSALVGHGDPLMLDTALVSEHYFSVFGARATEGRLIEPDDFAASDVVVLSHETWVKHFGGDESVIGRAIRLDGKPITVIGVMERGFTAPEAMGTGRTQIFRPIDWTRNELVEHNYWMMEIAGRLAPGVSVEELESQVAVVVDQLAAVAPQQYQGRDGRGRPLPVTPLQVVTVRGVKTGLNLLLGAVTLLLVIACSNVAHLFLARGLARRPELAVRRALGASTTSLVRQMLVESIVVAVVGGLLGVALASVAVRSLIALIPETLPRGETVHLDLRVVVFAAGLSALTAIFFGLVPAIRSARSAAAQRSRRSTQRHGVGGLRGGLVIAEVALSMILIAGAGVLIRSFLEVNRQETGIDASGVWVVPLAPTGLEDGEEYRQLMNPIRDAMAAMPGVESATYGLAMPFSFTGGGRCCWRQGFSDPRAEDPEAMHAMFIHPVSSDYFRTLGVDLRQGAAWTRSEAGAQPFPAVIPESTAATVFGSSESVIGRTLESEEVQLQIIGVVGDIRHFGLDQALLPEIYVPVDMVPFGEPLGALAVRFAPAAPAGVEKMLRETVWSVDPDLPVPTVTSMDDQIASSTAFRRFESLVFSTFGLVALLLAAGGLYGTLLYAVGQRRREMGIRLALGALRRQVEGQVLKGGLWVSGLGIGLGLVGAWLTARFLESRIWGVEARDPTTLVAATGVLFLTAVAASWLPARAASGTDPAETLRAD